MKSQSFGDATTEVCSPISIEFSGKFLFLPHFTLNQQISATIFCQII